MTEPAAHAGEPVWLMDDFDKHVVHDLGLTDAILSRVQAPWGRPGHKLVGNYPVALARVLARYPELRGRGLYRHARDERKAPRWVRDNLRAIEVIERKIYNRHELVENLRLALQPLPRIPG